MNIFKKFFIFLFFLFIIYIVLSFTFLPYFIKNKIIDTFSNFDVTLKEVKFNPFELDLNIVDFVVKDKNDYTLISLKNFYFDFNFLQSIFKKCLCLNNIIIDDLVLNIVQDKDNNLNILKILESQNDEDKIKEDDKNKEKDSSFKFLISLISFKNSSINFTSNLDNKNFQIRLSDINYKSSNLGNINDLPSLNNLELNINNHTNIKLNASLNLKSFLASGNISINNFYFKDYLDFNNEFFNFKTNEKGKLDLNLEYKINFKEDLSLEFKTNLFTISDLNLIQNNSSLGSLKKLDIDKLEFDLINKNINFNKIKIDNLITNMILDENGFNYSNLINISNEENEIEENLNDEFYENFENFYEEYYDDYYSEIFDDEDYQNLYIEEIQTDENNENSYNKEIINDEKELQKSWIINFSDVIVSSGHNFNNKIDKQNIRIDSLDIILKNLKIISSFVTFDNANISNKNLDYSSKDLKANLKNTKIIIDNFIFDDDFKLEEFILNNENIFLENLERDNTLKLDDYNYSNNENIIVDFLDINLKNLKVFDLSFIFDSGSILNKSTEYNSNNAKAKAKNNEININNFSYDDNKIKFSKIDLNNIDVFLNLIKQNSKNKENNEIKISENSNESDFGIQLGEINLNKLNFDFKNDSLKNPFELSISNINGKIGEINEFEDNNNFDIKINSVINKYSPSTIIGKFDSENFRKFVNLNIKFKNISLNDFSAYSSEYLGKKIDSGKLDLNLEYKIKNSNLNSKNNIVINKIKLGKDIEKSNSLLPIQTAINLLEDKNKTIDINIPINGNIDSPKFNLLDLFWQSFSSLITKSVTAPFSILAYAFNFNEHEINSIKFEQNNSEIETIQKEALDKIALILKNKNNISIKLVPSYDEKNESKRIGVQRIKNIKEYLVEIEQINSNQVILDYENENTKSTSIILNIEYLLE